MKLGIGTYAYAWAIGSVTGQPPANPMDTTGFIRRCAERSVYLAQIADNLPLHMLQETELAQVLAEAKRLGIALEIGTRGIAPDLLRTYIQIAQRAGSSILRTVIDTADHRPAIPEIIETLKDAMPEFERADVRLAVENHDRFRAREFAHIVEQVGSSHLGICLDTVNSFGALEGPAVVVETLGPYVINLHVKDFSIRRAGHTMGFIVEGTPTGKGRLNVPWLLDQLNELSDYDFNAVLELWPPPEANIEDTVRKEDRWAAESVTYLRTLISG